MLLCIQKREEGKFGRLNLSHGQAVKIGLMRLMFGRDQIINIMP